MSFDDKRGAYARRASMNARTLKLTSGEAQILRHNFDSHGRPAKRFTIQSYVELVLTNLGPVDSCDGGGCPGTNVERNPQRQARR